LLLRVFVVLVSVLIIASIIVTVTILVIVASDGAGSLDDATASVDRAKSQCTTNVSFQHRLEQE
jgi:hypothetical protein